MSCRGSEASHAKCQPQEHKKLQADDHGPFFIVVRCLCLRLAGSTTHHFQNFLMFYEAAGQHGAVICIFDSESLIFVTLWCML